MSDAESDAELVRRWSEGDRAAGGRFAARHFDTLWTYFRNKVADAPDDLIQATLVEAQRYSDRLAKAENVRAYLLSIARSQLRLHYRAHRDSQDIDDISIADLRSGASTHVRRKQRQETVARALQQLPLKHQEILELHYWSELSVLEIAEVLAIPEGTVKSRLIRARQALAEQASDLQDLDDSLRNERPSP